MSSSTKIVRWGILGTARIATKVGKAIRDAACTELVAIASRSAARAAEWARENDAEQSYGSYEALLDDPEIDAVYIPLPPSMHAEWTVRAAERGKHVLSEKPLAATSSQAEEMAAACRQHNVQLMDGVMWVHHPRTADMERTIRDGTLGTIRRIISAFTFNREFPLDDLRMQRSLGGGSLLDLGWYCIRASLWTFNRMPQRVFGAARYRNDVDVNFSALMWLDEETTASFDCAFNTGMRKWMEVAGSDASLVCDDFTMPWNVDKPRFWLHDSGGKMSEHVSKPLVQEVCMIENFCDAIRSGKLNEAWRRDAVATQRLCEALDKSARSGAVVELK